MLVGLKASVKRDGEMVDLPSDTMKFKGGILHVTVIA